MSEKPDDLYDRGDVLLEIRTSLGAATTVTEADKLGLFIVDLSDPSNSYGVNTTSCINFIEGHVYHFGYIYFPYSYSHIAFLEEGKLKIFESVNCTGDNNHLADAIDYINRKLSRDADRFAIITRLKNYRRYGLYINDDRSRVACKKIEPIPNNTDPLYDRWKVLLQFAEVLDNFSPETTRAYYPPFFRVFESRGSGFFIYDLTDPTNKQTSLLERVEFKDGHVYHFAFIDEPFSFSHIAILEDGKMKIFKGVNCPNKGDNIQDVLAYLGQKLKGDRNGKDILKKVKNYRKYGVYVPYPGFSKLQCD